ncbi:transglutaminase-like putative cysteine protease [Nocardiopsis mwathae]|uniref:Transglutaminase-like putative cysteine protease n=1 Tax=Nocardiopsis mwathae TaxID=1472723 RepID=A0A7W9YHZ3_9ACTN|nr:transglutaminaseTgpA domain-containing protein [Nocardiopsis mwathae]MBB6172462.1 transglutaminase-like putative cysteine protease [Nocardiopsis mwathae]
MLAVLAALPVLAPILRGDGWWTAAAVTVAAVALTGVVVRVLRVSEAVLPLLQAAAGVIALTALFAPGQAVAGLIPTPESAAALLSLAAEGRAEIDASPAPVAAGPVVALVVALGMGLLALLADFLAVTARMPALVGLPLAGMALLVLSVDDQGIAWWAFALAAAGYLGLLGVDSWIRAGARGIRPLGSTGSAARAFGALRRAATAGAVAAAAIALALLVPVAVPGLGDGALFRMAQSGMIGNDAVTTTHPLVSLRTQLADDSGTAVLSYGSDDSDPDYLRTYVLDVFDGENWTMSSLRAGRNTRVGADDRLPLPPGTPRLTGDPVRTEVSVAGDARDVDFLPMPYPALSVDVGGEWFADPATQMVFRTGGGERSLDYRVDSVRPRPSAAELAASGGTPGVDPQYLRVPEDVDPRVAELARSVVGGARTPHERAVALQDWFTGAGGFTYDLRPPPLPEGADPLAHFLLEGRVGYCEQFAGAMALMARQIGVPARVATGYTAGTQVADDRWEVRRSDAHAWPELYFEGQGWLRFEPTPSSGDGQGTASVPSYAEPAPEPGGAADDPGPRPDTAEERPERPDPAGPEAEDPAAPAPGSATEGTGGSADAAALGRILQAAAVALLVLLAPALTATAVRHLRQSGATTDSARARAAWLGLRDEAADLGVPWSPAESPRTIARRLAVEYGLSGAAREAVWRIALAEESARYAPRPVVPRSLAADVHTVRRALRRRVGLAARVRGTLLPRSLLRRAGDVRRAARVRTG